MNRLFPLAVLTMMISQIAQGDDTRSTRQRYVLHVPAKVALESAELPVQGATESALKSNHAPFRAAFRLSGTGSAGITAQFESRATRARDGKFAAARLNLRVAADERNRWILEGDEQTGPRDASGTSIQASSTGAGAATLIISSEGNLEGMEIITTVISND